MGTPGVPLQLPKSTILEAIKKHKGVATRICAELGIHHQTLLTHTRKDPELDKALVEARHARDEEDCDLAEQVLRDAMEQRQEWNASIKASMYLLNNKGKDRGYAPIIHGVPASEPRLDAIDGNSTDLVNDPKS